MMMEKAGTDDAADFIKPRTITSWTRQDHQSQPQHGGPDLLML